MNLEKERIIKLIYNQVPFKYKEVIIIDNKRFTFTNDIKPIIKRMNNILNLLWSILFISILFFSLLAITKITNIWLQLFISISILGVHIIIFLVTSKYIMNKNLPNDPIVLLEL